MGHADFVEAFRAAVRPVGSHGRWDPWKFAEVWREFVAHVVDGYEFGIYEYENELSVRDDLQRALDDGRLEALSGWAAVRTEVEAADDGLRAALEGDPEIRPDAPWWRRHLPAVGGGELAEDARRLYGVEVRTEEV